MTNYNSIDELLKDTFAGTYREPTPQIYRLNHDVLAISVCAYRLSTNNPPVSFANNDFVMSQLSDEDNRVADNIRKYYAKKYMWTTLKGGAVSEFQQSVLDFISNDNRQEYTEKQEGLIHKLPEFYFNDIVVDEIFKNADVSAIDDPVPKFLRAKYTKTLKPINVIHQKTRQVKENNYWLKDEENRLCLMSISQPNSLEHLWLDFFNNHATIRINAHYLAHQNRNGHFYKIVDWKLEK